MLDKLYTQFILLLIIAELSYINAKSLLFIVSANGRIDTVFAIIGSVGFSAVTVLVMRNPILRWPKKVFPLFDTALVFFGLNVGHANNLLADPVRFGLTVFMAAFAGLITYSLGTITHKSDARTDTKELEQLGAELQQATATVQQQKNELEQSAASLQQRDNELLQTKETLQQQSEKLQQQHYTLLENEDLLLQTQGELQQAGAKLLQLEKELQQFREACTCPYCGEVFGSESSKRSHMGKCKKRSEAVLKN